MPFHRDAWWLMGSAIAAIAAAPLIVHGDAQTSTHRAATAQKIEQLSPADRQELEENFKRFQKLPAADQAKYREIHSKVEQNPAVAEALGSFSLWWPTVSAREQAELFKQQDVKQRIAVVSQIQEEIDKDRGGRLFFGRGYRRDGFRGPPLPRDNFYEIMQELEAIASETYSVDQSVFADLQTLDVKNPQRYVKLFTALHDKKKTWSNLIENPNMENRILESVSDKKIQELERELLNSKFNPPGQKHFWIRLQLGMAFGRELYFDMLKYSGGESDLVKKLASLSKDERDELYALSAEDIRLRLKMRILDDANAPVREFFQLRDVRPGEGSGRGGEGPGRGEGPMGRGGDGPGRGGDGPMGRGEGPGRGGEGPGRGEGPPPRMD